MAESTSIGALSVVVLLGSGITMGVFFAVAISVSPALLQMPPARYVEAHRLLGKGYHPAMPMITNATMLAGFVLGFLVSDPSARALLLLGGVLVIGIQAVSHLGNVPINRELHRLAEAGGWTDPRPRWSFWHQIRTALAALALLANSIAIVIY